MKRESFGERLRQARKQLHWSQERLARAIGASASSINRWENDKVLPQPFYREQLSQVLEIKDVLASSATTTGMHPLPLWHVPPLRNIYFTGREDVLDTLHQIFTSPGQMMPYALSGLGGIGKTQTALEYAYRYSHHYDAIVWLHADTYQTLIADFTAFAHILGLTDKQHVDQHDLILVLLNWFHIHQNWLLIYDNADDLEVVREFMPSRLNGNILLTTRHQATGNSIKSIELDMLLREDGILLLLRRAQVIAADERLCAVAETIRQDAERVYDVLGGLPLALSQAAAYIDENRLSFHDYLVLFETQQTALLQWRGRASLRDYPYSVVTSWVLTFEHIEHLSPVASDLLRLLAFLHPDAVPETLITLATVDLGSQLQPALEDGLLFNDAIGILRRFSLVQRYPETKLLVVHRLVQTVLIASLTQEQQRTWAQRSICLVDDAFPNGEVSSWPRCQQLLPHVQVCISNAQRWHIESLPAAHLFNRAGKYLIERGQFAQAETPLVLAMTIYEKMLGTDHRDLATNLHHLGLLYLNVRQFTRSRPLLERALAIFERVLPQEHPEVAHIHNTLGWLYCDTGHFDLAEPHLLLALEIRSRVLGPLHLDIAESLNEVAMLYNYTGRNTEAERLYKRAIAVLEQLPGPPHYYQAISLNNLAKFFTDQGRYAEAEPLFYASLAIAEQVLSLDHPNVVIGFNNLANLYIYQDKETEAEDLLLKTLQRTEQVWGPDHLYIALSLHPLAKLYYRQGKYREAEALFQRVIAIRERVVGPEHPMLADCLSNLATLYLRQKKDGVAEILFQRALAILERKFAPNHPLMIKVIKDFTTFLCSNGREQEAQLLQRRLQQAVS